MANQVIRIGPQGGRIKSDKGGKVQYASKDEPSGKPKPKGKSEKQLKADIAWIKAELGKLHNEAWGPGGNPSDSGYFQDTEELKAQLKKVEAELSGKPEPKAPDLSKLSMDELQSEFGKAKATYLDAENDKGRVDEYKAAGARMTALREEGKRRRGETSKGVEITMEASKGRKVIRIGTRGGKITSDKGGKKQYAGKDEGSSRKPIADPNDPKAMGFKVSPKTGKVSKKFPDGNTSEFTRKLLENGWTRGQHDEGIFGYTSPDKQTSVDIYYGKRQPGKMAAPVTIEGYGASHSRIEDDKERRRMEPLAKDPGKYLDQFFASQKDMNEYAKEEGMGPDDFGELMEDLDGVKRGAKYGRFLNEAQQEAVAQEFERRVKVSLGMDNLESKAGPKDVYHEQIEGQHSRYTDVSIGEGVDGSGRRVFVVQAKRPDAGKHQQVSEQFHSLSEAEAYVKHAMPGAVVESSPRDRHNVERPSDLFAPSGLFTPAATANLEYAALRLIGEFDPGDKGSQGLLDALAKGDDAKVRWYVENEGNAADVWGLDRWSQMSHKEKMATIGTLSAVLQEEWDDIHAAPGTPTKSLRERDLIGNGDGTDAQPQAPGMANIDPTGSEAHDALFSLERPDLEYGMELLGKAGGVDVTASGPYSGTIHGSPDGMVAELRDLGFEVVKKDHGDTAIYEAGKTIVGQDSLGDTMERHVGVSIVDPLAFAFASYSLNYYTRSPSKQEASKAMNGRITIHEGTPEIDEMSKGRQVIRVGERGGKIVSDKGGKKQYQGKEGPRSGRGGGRFQAELAKRGKAETAGGKGPKEEKPKKGTAKVVDKTKGAGDTVREARSKLFDVKDQDGTTVSYELDGKKHTETAREARSRLYDVKDQDGTRVGSLSIDKTKGKEPAPKAESKKDSGAAGGKESGFDAMGIDMSDKKQALEDARNDLEVIMERGSVDRVKNVAESNYSARATAKETLNSIKDNGGFDDVEITDDMIDDLAEVYTEAAKELLKKDIDLSSMGYDQGRIEDMIRGGEYEDMPAKEIAEEWLEMDEDEFADDLGYDQDRIEDEELYEDRAGMKEALVKAIEKARKDAKPKVEAPRGHKAAKAERSSYSWGDIVNLELGASGRAVLHPDGQEKIAKLDDGEKTTYKDEQGYTWKIQRVGDEVYLGKQNGGLEMKAKLSDVTPK